MFKCVKTITVSSAECVCVCVGGGGDESIYVHFSLLYLNLIMYQLQFYQISGASSF